MFFSKKLWRGVSLASACGLLLAFGMAEAASMGPELDVEARYDDNVLKTPHGLSDFVSVFIPRMRATEVEGMFPWELRLRSTVASYGRAPSPIALSDLVLMRGAYYMAAQESVSVGYRYTRSSEPTDFEETNIITGGDVYANSGHLGINAWRAEGDLRVRTWSYERAGLSDGASQALDLRYYPIRARNLGWIVDYRGDNLDLDDRGLTSNVLTTGIQRSHARWLSSEASFGVEHATFDDGSPDENHPAVALGLVIERGEQASPTRARFKIAHDLTTTGIAEVQRSWEVMRVIARYEKTLDAEGGVYRSPTLSRRAGLSIQATPDGVRRVMLDGSYRQVRPFRGTQSVDANIWRFAVSYATPLKSWLWARTSYDFVSQQVPVGGRGDEFERNRFILSFTAGMPR